MNAPPLHRRDLEVELDELCLAERRHFLFALYGTGAEDLVHLEKSGRAVRIVPVRSELELRERLLDHADDDAAAFLVPWSGSLPLDLAGRFAKHGRIFRVGPETRLRGLFGAVDVDDAVRSSPLAEYLVKHHGDARFEAGGRLTIDALWAQWLAVAWGLEMPGGLALDVLLGFVAVDGRGAEFTRTMKERDAGSVREALLAYLERKVGPAGPIVWRAWEAGQGETALQMAVLAQAMAGVEDGEALVWWEMTVENALGAEVAKDTAALRRLGEVCEPALRAVERRTDAATVRRIVAAADALVRDRVRPELAASPRLPSAWAVRLQRLGEALAVGAAEPGRDAVKLAAARLKELSGHVFYRDGAHTLTVERAEMAVRLLGWLATRADKELVRAPTPYAEVETLAAWFVAEGGFVDWARRWARGGGSGALADGIQAVVRAADQARIELDRSFAGALPAYLEAGRPAVKCVPIDQAVARVAGPFLKEDPERRLLVLLLDGMSWAQAVEILSALGHEAAAWGPLAWHGMAKGRIGDAPYPPVLANFPTVTEISRAGFFLGKPVPTGPEHKTSDDPERWKKNKTALAFTEHDHEAPRLLLRGESQSGDGSASQEALSLVEGERRVVAVVINVIDNFLKSDVGDRRTWTADSIRSLRDLLDRARDAGRAVLLCADHGNVPSDIAEHVGGAATKPRYRVWESPDEPLADYEVGLEARFDGVWAPRGKHGVVLLADEAHQYSNHHHNGEHGGASLAEVVAPCLLIGCDHGRPLSDPGQAVRPLTAPAWWHFDLGAEPAAAAPKEEKKPRKKPKTENQLSLLPEPAPAPAEPRVAAKPSAAPSAFAKSKVLAARCSDAALRARTAAAVEYLLERDGYATAAAFAAVIGVFPTRIGGAISRLQEVLNVDGYEVLAYDRSSGQIRLHADKLRMLFEVDA